MKVMSYFSFSLILLKLGFQITSDAGAMVMLEPPGVTEDMQSRRHVVDYMRNNFDSWLEFANAAWGLGIRPEDLLFVCGTLKTTQWALAAFQGSMFRNQLGHISEQLSSIGDSQVFQIFDHKIPSTNFRAGPRLPTVHSDSNHLADRLPRNQCLFIHYYKMKRRFWWSHPLRAAAGPHQLPPGADNRGPEAMSPGGARRAPPCEFGPDGHGHGDVRAIAVY